MRNRNPKIQIVRKLGHLWQIGFGPTVGNVSYGYDVTRKLAGQKARAEYHKHKH